MLSRLLSLYLAAALLLAPSLAWSAPPTTATRLQESGTVILPSAARTTTQTTGWFTSGSGVIIVADVTAITATPVLTITIEVYDQAQDAAILFQTLTSTLAAVAITRYGFWGSGTTTANAALTEFKAHPLPGFWRLVLTANDADSATYSVVGYAVPQ